MFRRRPSIGEHARTRALPSPIRSCNPDTGYPVIAMGYPIRVDGRDSGRRGVGKYHDGRAVELSEHAQGQPQQYYPDCRSTRQCDCPSGDGQGFTALPRADRARDADRDSTIPASGQGSRAAQGAGCRPLQLRPCRRAARSMSRCSMRVPSNNFPGNGKSSSWLPPTTSSANSKQTNRKLIWLMITLVLLESALIYFMAGKISRPIEIVSGAIERIRSLSFDQSPASDLRGSVKSASFRGRRPCSRMPCGRSRYLSPSG